MTEPNNNLLLDVRNLCTTFSTEEGTVKAVDDISFSLSRRETIGIVGESGSGKSVTSLSVMRLIPYPPGKITGGEILYYDREKQAQVDLTKVTEAEMRHYRGNAISMIFQEPMTSLNPVYTCGDQVMEAIMLHQKKSKREAAELTLSLFDNVKLPNPQRILNAYPHQLSGGQKQRVMIAMAMSCEPDILIADEPTTALDVTVQKTILDLMYDLKEKNDMGIMFITHDLGVISDIADKVVVMYKGKIVEQGSVLDIFANPQHPYTKGLLACRPPLGRRLRKLPTIRDFMKEENGQILEIESDMSKVLDAVVVTPEETTKRRENLLSQEPVLKVENLEVWFPSKKTILGKVTDYVKAVDGITFDVRPGETLGLVGESGCGKTTTGRAILRLIEPTGGKVIYNGESLLDKTQTEMKNLRKEMQIIFQDPYSSLNPRITIGNAILEPMKVHNLYGSDKERTERVYDLLQKVNMRPEHFTRYPHEFSGGQRQRICIARALALNPKFIICDESVSALDVSVQAQVLNLLIDLREEFKFSYIFISHDLSVVKFMSDRMVVMNKGKIEEMGVADEIYNNPQHPYTQKLIDAIPKGTIEYIQQRLARN